MSTLPDAQRKPGRPRTSICQAADCRACAVRELTFCLSLDAEEVGALAEIAVRLEIQAGTMLFQEHDPAEHVYNVTNGAVRLYKLMTDGRRQITGFLLPGDFLGVAGNDGYACSAEAISDVCVCRFSRAKLEELMERRPKLGRALLRIMTEQLVASQDQMLLLGRKTASEKIASFLLLLSEREALRGANGNPVHLPMTRSDIGDYLGLTLETVSRVLSQFRRDGLVRQRSLTEIEMLDREALVALTEG